MIYRFSSRRQAISETFLNTRLRQAQCYDRIAGYFSSSILEVAGESIESITGKIRLVCNAELAQRDVETARAAEMAVGQEWRFHSEDKLTEQVQPRLQRLYKFLKSGKMEVRILPNEIFGLIHGKAGIITQSDGKKTAFLGSINESKTAWKLNYELLWEDDSEEAISWVQEEFNTLWFHPKAVPLAHAVVEDIKRLANRRIITLDQWKDGEKPEGAIVETPVYRKQYGLWAHQKSFVKLAYEEHLCGRGARFVLADQVGLGKTVQLALAAMLMALHGDKPILVIAPKTLIWQWQEEIKKLLDFPSAVWDGKAWVDENEVRFYNSNSENAITKCPRRVGIISQGLIVRGGALVEKLLEKNYECVIVDECHRARRRNLHAGCENESPDPNKLMKYILRISRQTKSLLLATATPVQLYPIEAYDLLLILAVGSNHVLGDELSKWRKRDKQDLLELVQGRQEQPKTFADRWDWIRDPFPPEYEDDRVWGHIRRQIGLRPVDYLISGDQLRNLKPWDRKKLEDYDSFFTKSNPFIRHIIRRTRTFLEENNDPITNEPFLKKVAVKLFGEDDNETILLPGYLQDAYNTTEEFCNSLGEIMKSSGFIRTLLLRRMGSSIEAGRLTALKMLGKDTTYAELTEEDDDDLHDDNLELAVEADPKTGVSARITEKDKSILQMLIAQLEQNQENDPKVNRLRELLFTEKWIDSGCIVFSQYFDTVRYFSSLIAEDHPEIPVAVYAGGSKSGIWFHKEYQLCSKEDIKQRVQTGEIKIIFGTDSASEGLNLQRLGTLINIDLPWNPTRLEQRKGRIQRIGQVRDEVFVYNMRYHGSVEDRVHQLLSQRLQNINAMFGQLPDILEDVWVEIAIGNKKKAQEIINAVPERNPFELRYDRIEHVDFEKCSEVLNKEEVKMKLGEGW